MGQTDISPMKTSMSWSQLIDGSYQLFV